MRRLLVSLAASGLLLVGCSDDSATTTPATDTGAATDTGVARDTSIDTGSAMDTAAPAADAMFIVVNGCAEADYVDATTDEARRTLSPWAVDSGKRCFKIKKGQSFTWVPTGGLAAHPLEPEGGDMPTPITLVSTGTTTTVAFPNEGKFGYHCANHPAVMLGAIWVVP